jgi:hypothetical protein
MILTDHLPNLNWPGGRHDNDGDGWYSYSFTNVNSAIVILMTLKTICWICQEINRLYSNGVGMIRNLKFQQ